MTAALLDPVDRVEDGFRAGTPRRLAALDAHAENAERLVALEVRAQDTAQRAADALAKGNRDDGVLLLVCALVTTEEIDELEAKGTR